MSSLVFKNSNTSSVPTPALDKTAVFVDLNGVLTLKDDLGNTVGYISGNIGSNTQVLYNDAGNVAGNSNFTWNKASNLLTVTGNITATAGFTMTAGNANFDSGVLFVDGTNNRVGVNTTTPGYALEVTGSFAATTKSFIITHPTKPDMKLRYGSLEGPENGVYVRGRTKGDTIQLPDYWTGLVDESSITAHLTPIGSHQKLYVKSIENNTVIVGGGFFDEMEYFYTVFAERKDVDKLVAEI